MVLIGRITKDANIKKLKDGREVVNFAIAVNDWYKQKGTVDAVTHTNFYNCSYWITPKIASRLTKGSLVEVEGRLTVNAYTGLDGEAKASLNYHVNSITIHSSAKKTDNQVVKGEEKEDLPF